MKRDASSQYYAVLGRISPGYSTMTGRLHTCYAPVRRSPSKVASYLNAAPRLACVKPVASVHPEPGSNSPLLIWRLCSISYAFPYACVADLIHDVLFSFRSCPILLKDRFPFLPRSEERERDCKSNAFLRYDQIFIQKFFASQYPPLRDALPWKRMQR